MNAYMDEALIALTALLHFLKSYFVLVFGDMIIFKEAFI